MYVSNEVIDSRKIFRVSLTIKNYHTMIFALIYFDVVDQQQMHKFFCCKAICPTINLTVSNKRGISASVNTPSKINAKFKVIILAGILY